MQPWYMFQRIDNFGQIDPQGNYYKPDTNILTPPLYPVQAVLSGTVTNVRRTDWGQTVVTEKLDIPLNPLATHMFFEHMHSSSVSNGDKIIPGTIIGLTNGDGEGANLGVGLYSGDVYGSGNAWNILQNDLKPGGAGFLNPITLIQSLQSGGPLPIIGFTSSSTNNYGSTFETVSQQAHKLLNNVPGFQGIVEALDTIETFQPWQLPQSGNSDADIPIIGGIVSNITHTAKLPADAMQATLIFVATNAMAFLIRASMVIIGMVIMTALIYNIVGINPKDIISTATTAGEIAA